MSSSDSSFSRRVPAYVALVIPRSSPVSKALQSLPGLICPFVEYLLSSANHPIVPEFVPLKTHIVLHPQCLPKPNLTVADRILSSFCFRYTAQNATPILCRPESPELGFEEDGNVMLDSS